MGTRLSCRECYASVELKYPGWVNLLLKERKVCLFCSTWIDTLSQKDDPTSVRVNGIQYWLREKSCNLEDGLALISFHDGRFVQIPKSRLFQSGTIPDGFKTRLTDNAVFIAEEGKNGST